MALHAKPSWRDTASGADTKWARARVTEPPTRSCASQPGHTVARLVSGRAAKRVPSYSAATRTLATLCQRRVTNDAPSAASRSRSDTTIPVALVPT